MLALIQRRIQGIGPIAAALGPVHCAYAVQVRWTVEGEPDRLVEGNQPHHKREPKPEIKVPTCPAHLCPSARAEWKRLIGGLFVLGVATALDRAALAAYRQAYGRWAEAERNLKDTPVLITRVEARPPCQRKSWELGRE